MADPGENTQDLLEDEMAHEEIADEALVEEVSIDGMCGVY